MATTGGFMSAFFKNNILGIGASLLFALLGEIGENQTSNLKSRAYDAWGYLDGVRTDWNSRRSGTVFQRNTIRQVRLALPVLVYRNNDTGRNEQIIVDKGYMIGAITSDGIELTL